MSRLRCYDAAAGAKPPGFVAYPADRYYGRLTSPDSTAAMPPTPTNLLG